MNTNDIFEQRQNFYLRPSNTLKGAMFVCLALGLVTFIYGFTKGEGTQVWGAFLFNLFFFFSLAIGGMAFAAMQDVIGAQWGRPIKRLHEGFGAFVPVAALLFIVFLMAIVGNVGGAGAVFKWVENPDMVHHFFGKNVWLNRNFMVTRDVVMLVIIVLVTFWQLKMSLGRDLKFVAGQRDEALSLGNQAKQKLRYWGGGVLIVYGLCYTFLAFDLTMSLSPLWFSTLWGGWLFAIMMQTLMATLLLIMFALNGSTIGSLIKRQQFHDVGKLMHGFTIFFAYLTYAHVLTYWYGNMPEETEYFIHRLHAPWIYIVLAVPIFSFVIPLYVLVFKAAKWTASVTIPLCLMILIAQWYTYLLVVMPEVVQAESWNLPIIEIGVFLGFLGLFMAIYLWFGRRYPMVPVADPLLAKALVHEH